MSEAKQMITEDQLKKIQGFQKDLNKLLNEVGFLESQKAQVLGKFGEVNKQTEELKKEFDKIKLFNQKFSKIDELLQDSKNFVEKYDVIIFELFDCIKLEYGERPIEFH